MDRWKNSNITFVDQESLPIHQTSANKMTIFRVFVFVLSIISVHISLITVVVCFAPLQPLSVSKEMKDFRGTHFFLKNSSNDIHDNSSISHKVLDRLDISSRFSRWKILQDILEEEETPTAQDINEILFLTLKSFLDHPRPLTLPNGDTNPSPTLNNEQRDLLVNKLFEYHKDDDEVEEGKTIGFIKAIPTDDSGKDSMEYENEETIEVYQLLENLHPNREEDEDAFKGCWDLVMELYGKESTKISEQSGDKCWKMRSSVVRLLIHYDFLVDGL